MEPVPIIPTVPDQENKQGIPLIFIFDLLLVIVLAFSGYWIFTHRTTNDTLPIDETALEQPLPNSLPTKATKALPATTPTPRPTGPGPFACSSLGSCKIWNTQIQKDNCTVTFADNNCLDQCGDITKRCKI